MGLHAVLVKLGKGTCIQTYPKIMKHMHKDQLRKTPVSQNSINTAVF
jgi:hypothetical protein